MNHIRSLAVALAVALFSSPVLAKDTDFDSYQTYEWVDEYAVPEWDDYNHVEYDFDS